MNKEFIRPELLNSFIESDGILSFIDENSLAGDNLKYNKLYNRIARAYNISQRIYFLFKFGSEKNYRMPFLSKLEIKDNTKVLEVSIGTGDNLRFLNDKAQYFGADISMKMLKQAKKHLKKWHIKAELIHCEGESLPFPDNYFDVVYHCGGINYFNNIESAISEMIRVAKPGIKIMIVDETDKLVRESYQKNPFLKNLYSDSNKAAAPVDLIPKTMGNLEVSVMCKGLMYCVTFNKP